MFICALLSALVLHQSVIATHRGIQETAPSRILTVERLLGPEFAETGFAPSGDWLPDSHGMVSVEGNSDIVTLDAMTGKRRIVVNGARFVPADQTDRLAIERFWFTSDMHKVLIFTHSVKVWRQNTKGDYWVLDIESGKLQKLGPKANPSSLMFAKFSPDGSKAGFVFDNNLYVQDLKTEHVEQMTTDTSPTAINGTFDWVYEEELDLRDGWRWSPDSKKIAFWHLETRMEPLYSLINDTDTQYPVVTKYPYPKTGEANPTVRLGVIDLNQGQIRWVDDRADTQSGYFARMDWASNSSEILYEKLNRKQNTNEYKLADVESGVARVIYTDIDKAWVDILDTAPNGVRWVEEGNRFLVFSERGGWRHVYSVKRDGSGVMDLTPGNFDVKDLLGLDSNKGAIYFTASPNSSVQTYLFVSNMDNPHPTTVTPDSEVGSNEYRISPDGKIAIHTISQFGVPPTRNLVKLPSYEVVRTFGDNSPLKAKLKRLHLGVGKLMRLVTADGQKMDASVIYPPNFDSKKRYPLFFEVYGEPAGTTVHDSWEGFDYLFRQLIAQRGYIVASVDNRGTPTLMGRDWRKSVYKKIGIVASSDQAAATKQLSALPYVDRSRVGIWGWSGGGTMTLNMLFRYPELYSLGMSVAPVPDASLYDTIYQERYMGTPQSDPTAYRNCSPITFAKNLKGSLLIVHGSGDDNVHFQGTERLIDELVENNKPFQLMVYPNRTHAINEGIGTSRHLYELLLRYLLNNLRPGPNLLVGLESHSLAHK